MAPELTEEELAFLRFHFDPPRPSRWEWRSLVPNEPAACYAFKPSPLGEVSLRISGPGFAKLRPYWDDSLVVNKHGQALLKELVR